MNPRISVAVYRKEMLELLRDRRTIISMVIVPLLLFPALISVVSGFKKAQTKAAENSAVRVGIASEQNLGNARETLTAAGLRLVVTPDLRHAVQEKQVATAVESEDLAHGALRFRVLEDETREDSRLAAEKVRTALETYKANLLRAKLRSLGVPPDVLSSVAIESRNIASQEQMGKFILGGMAGYLMLLLMFTGGMYPAIDTGAGEKERRTIETLLASPASRIDIILGKIGACATASFLTALLSLFSFMFFAKKAMEGLGPTEMTFQLDLPTAALLLLSVVPIAVLGASAMVAISLLAKSYKEGQSYVMPLLMAVIFPIVLGTFMNIELTPLIALIPVLNTALVMKQIFAGSVSAVSFSLPLLLNLIYAAVVIAIATRIFRNENALFRT